MAAVRPTAETATNTAPYRIRPATPEDWPGIWEILEPVIRAGETYTWNRDTSEDEARGIWFKEPPGQTFVAVQDGAVIGTGALQANQGGGGSHVANAGYMVHSGHGGKGVARSLCLYSLDAAKAAGFRAMQFNAVVETNDRAVKAWRSLGFDVIGTIPEAFNHPRHGFVGLHVMYRKL